MCINPPTKKVGSVAIGGKEEVEQAASTNYEEKNGEVLDKGHFRRDFVAQLFWISLACTQTFGGEVGHLRSRGGITSIGATAASGISHMARNWTAELGQRKRLPVLRTFAFSRP